MLGIPSPDLDPGAVSGTVLKFFDTLGEITETSGATLTVSLAVIATLGVFERWIKTIPGGLVAVVSAIAVSWAFDPEHARRLRPRPRAERTAGDRRAEGASARSDVPMLLATSLSMYLVIIAQSAPTSRGYAVKYKERLRREHRPRRA